MDNGLLYQEAEAAGLQTEYTTAEGAERKADPESLRMLLQRLEGDAEPESRYAEPVAVLWNGKGTIRFRTSLPRKARLYLEDEAGELFAVNFKSTGSVTEVEVSALPLGYYQAILETANGTEEFLLICAPQKCYSVFGQESAWGAFAPTYSLRSKTSWGAGNLSSLGEFATWVSDRGGKVACTLPLLDCFLNKPFCEPSPYAPATRLFWNEFYIDIERLPELAANREAQQLVKSGKFQKEISSLRARELVDYGKEYQLRKRVLRLLARNFQPPAKTRFDEYAKFRAACDYYNKPWSEWPSKVTYREEDYLYYLYVQTAVNRQMAELVGNIKSRGSYLFLDLPVGVHPAGYDVWKHRDLFVRNVSVGAPPDAFFTKGQNWGFAPLNPKALRNSGYKYLREYLGFLMGATGLMRIDHVMGLHRLYCVPNGMEATKGVYLRYNSEEQFAILALESWKHKCAVVGENLGTVPIAVNKAMKRHGVRGMYVFQFSVNAKKKPITPPPANSVAYVNTHDMPTFQGFATGKEIELRQSLGLLSRKDAAQAKADRKKIVAALKKYLKRDSLIESVFSYLAKSKAELVICNLEDFWGELNAQNVPGTITQHPNWRRRTKYTLEEITTKFNRLAAALSRPKRKVKR